MASEILKFDHIDNTADNHGAAIPEGYGGFTLWDNFFAINTNNLPNSGYQTGTRSGSGVACNDSGLDAKLVSHSTFSLKSGYLTGAVHSIDVTFSAFKHHHRVAQKTVTVDENHQTYVSFGKHFAHVHTIVISTGAEADSTNQFVLDNLRVIFDGAIPTAVHDGHVHVDAHARAMALLAPEIHHGDHWMFC